MGHVMMLWSMRSVGLGLPGYGVRLCVRDDFCGTRIGDLRGTWGLIRRDAMRSGVCCCRWNCNRWIVLAFCASWVMAGFALGAEVTLVADRDNTLYETASGTRSNGAGILFFVGRSGPSSGGQLKRGLLRFDVADALPAGAVVQEAVLRLRLYNTGPNTVASLTRLHRALSDWGEGGSDGLGSGGNATAGDATWLHRSFPDVFWDTPGGDYRGEMSGERLVVDGGFYTWGSTSEMVSDVQLWLDQSGSNFGWVVVGDEGGQRTAKGFATHEIMDDSSLPRLTITYDVSGVPGDCDGDADVDILDYSRFLECFTGAGGALGEACGCVDLDADGDVDLHDLGGLQLSFTGG